MNKAIINGIELVELPANTCHRDRARCHFVSRPGECPRDKFRNLLCMANLTGPVLYIQEADLLDLRLRGLA